jgi:hypothetical protein
VALTVRKPSRHFEIVVKEVANKCLMRSERFAGGTDVFYSGKLDSHQFAEPSRKRRFAKCYTF